MVKCVRTAVATATPPGWGAGLLRLVLLWLATGVRAVLELTALAVAIITFRLLGGEDTDLSLDVGAGGLGTAGLFVARGGRRAALAAAAAGRLGRPPQRRASTASATNPARRSGNQWPASTSTKR